MFQGILKDFGVEYPEQYRWMHILIASIVIIFTICLLRSVNSLRYATLISIGAVLYTCLVLFLELYFYWGKYSPEEKIVWFNFDDIKGILTSFGLTFFAFYCQVGFFPALENLFKLDPPHIKKVILMIDLLACFPKHYHGFRVLYCNYFGWLPCYVIAYT